MNLLLSLLCSALMKDKSRLLEIVNLSRFQHSFSFITSSRKCLPVFQNKSFSMNNSRVLSPHSQSSHFTVQQYSDQCVDNHGYYEMCIADICACTENELTRCTCSALSAYFMNCKEEYEMDFDWKPSSICTDYRKS